MDTHTGVLAGELGAGRRPEKLREGRGQWMAWPLMGAASPHDTSYVCVKREDSVPFKASFHVYS